MRDSIAKTVENRLSELDAITAAFEGNAVGVVLSLVGAPDLAIMGKLAQVKSAAIRAELALDALSKRGSLRGALKTVRGREAHHVVPVDTLDHSVVQAGILGGFDFNGVANGISVISQKAGGGTKIIPLVLEGYWTTLHDETLTLRQKKPENFLKMPASN